MRREGDGPGWHRRRGGCGLRGAALGAGLLVGLAGLAAAREGVVRTLDGGRFTGEIEFGRNVILVAGTHQVALTNLQRLAYDLPGPAVATARGRGLGLLGHYFANPNLSGSPAVRLDETIDFDWGVGEPCPDVPADGFGVVWSGEVEAPAAGDYTFHLQADDRARLLLGGTGAVESAAGQAESASAPRALQAGQRLPLRLEFTDRSGPARVRLLWSGPGLAKSVIPRDRLHPAGALPNQNVLLGDQAQGLLAVYYDTPNFAGRLVTRLDPGIDANWTETDPLPGFSRSAFSVRWSGQVLADHSEPYTFSVLADETARLWVDGRLVLATGGDTFYFERRETVMLTAGERHDLRFELQSTGGGATARLMWNSPSTPKAVIPANHLSPSRPSVRVAGLRPDQAPAGVLLRNGAFLAGVVESATDSSLRLAGRWQGRSLSLVNVARLVLQPVPAALAGRLESGRAGLLLKQGDFVEADFGGLAQGQVTMRSILFGAQAYDAQREGMAVILRAAAPKAGPYEIRLADRSVLGATTLSLEEGQLLVRDAVLGPLRIPVTEVELIQRGR